MRIFKLSPLLFSPILFWACSAPDVLEEHGWPLKSSSGSSQGRPPLAGWESGVVSPPRPGVVTTGNGGQGVGPSAEGRMHIIELYSQVLDERDALAREVTALEAALAESRAAFEQAGAERDRLAGTIGLLEEENAGLRSENEDLAGRLVTAQIRRLEAEKLLLEEKLGRWRALGAPADASAEREAGSEPEAEH